ncbi:MAG: threonine/serine dehydratase [Parvularculaceae bacterium]|jgi:threonine dehydratase|nr:threonine/serine dehydratase [Parvularculaceae bacterium]
MSASEPSFRGVLAAADRLKGRALVTPLLENAELNALVGGRILLKAEILQHCGSFKFRGAYNRLSRLSPDERRRGVLAWSSGNHAQGVARAGKMLGAPAVIVMPKDAPAIKAERVRADGAEIIAYDRYTDDREIIGRRIAAERGLALAPSFDDVDIIEGQGTLAVEAVAQARDLGAEFDRFVIPCGGGGMTAGCALALEELTPRCETFIAEPQFYDETWGSIASGERKRADSTKPTLCDAIATPAPGDLTLPVMRRLVRGGAAVSDEDVKAAIRFAFKYLKLVVEPGGAAALAAVLAGKIDAKGRIVGVVLSGGNVDLAVFAGILSETR